MDNETRQLSGPVFAKCPRCRYSLRGLPAKHACPECGLRYDENCGLYRVRNPYWAILMSVGACLVAGVIFVPDLVRFTTSPPWAKAFALLWLSTLVFMIVVSVSRFRLGLEVAVTGDGLLLRLPEWFDSEPIPWKRVVGAVVANEPAHNAHVAVVLLTDSPPEIRIGGKVDVFPTHADAERFVRQVNDHCQAAKVDQNPA